MKKLLCFIMAAVLMSALFSSCAEKDKGAKEILAGNSTSNRPSSTAVDSSELVSDKDESSKNSKLSSIADNSSDEIAEDSESSSQSSSKKSTGKSSRKSSSRSSSSSKSNKSSGKSSSKSSSRSSSKSSSKNFVSTTSEGLDPSCSHRFGKWEKISRSTCLKQGREERICKKCNGKEIGICDFADHDIEILPGIPATCHTTGITDGEKCKTCGKILAEKTFAPIDPSKHVFEEISADPDLLRSGYKRQLCTICGYNKSVENQGPVDPTILGIPVIYFDGDYLAATKEKKQKVEFSIKGGGLDLSGYATIKWQGNTAVKFEKKNYSVKFYEDEALTDKYKFNPFGWGKEYEYCLKANWVDATQSRNIVTARLWGQMCATRENLDKNLKDLPNYGAIDGYPVLVYMNGEYHGIYTMNIPKDKWMFDMKDDETKKQAILMGAQWGDSARLREEIPEDLGREWEIEHCSTKDTSWVVESFNNLIRFINEADDETFKKDISKYVDVDAAIDQIILAYASCGYDNYGKNVLYATYDGVKWIPSVYDMDATWGLWWDGTKYLSATEGLPVVTKKTLKFIKNENMLWCRLLLTHKDRIVKRYDQLRAGVLSDQNIKDTFSELLNGFPTMAEMAEAEKWPKTPMINTDYKQEVLKFIPKRMAYLDSFFDKYREMNP